MHVYNNYYQDIGVEGNAGYAMGPGVNAHFIVENNYFGSKVGNKNFEWLDTTQYPAKVFYTGNNIADSNTTWYGRASEATRPWTPGYAFTLDSNASLPASIPVDAGPTLVFSK